MRTSAPKAALAAAVVAVACACKSPPTTVGPADTGAASAASAVSPAPPASASSSAPAMATDAPPVDAAPPEPPLPNVRVVNIGMHIGGGPNDPPTKEPIAKSVEPHFDEFRRCFARVFDPTRGGDFGVDLLIPPAGGQAKVSHPRTSLKGEHFEECVTGIFAAVDFQKPRFGLTTVSYSLRFTPGT